jgi:hypothetical protein
MVVFGSMIPFNIKAAKIIIKIIPATVKIEKNVEFGTNVLYRCFFCNSA